MNFEMIYKIDTTIDAITEIYVSEDHHYPNGVDVKVSPAAAVEFQHYKDTIIEKINSFFED